MKRKILFWGLVAFAGLVVVGLLDQLIPNDPPRVAARPPAISPAETTARQACEDHLRAELHYPKAMALSNVRVGFSEDREWAAVRVDVAYETAFGDAKTWRIACKVWSNVTVETALPN